MSREFSRAWVTRRRSAAALGSVWLVAAASLAPAAAGAEPAPTTAAAPASSSAPGAGPRSAEALLERGIALRKRGDDLEAVAAFQRAIAIAPSPRAFAQLALGEQALGRWLDAREHLVAALARVDDPWIGTHRGTLQAALREIEAHLGRLELSCDVTGAEVQIDGRTVGRTPLPEALPLVAGQSVVQIAAEGYFPITRQVEIDAGGLSRIEVHLTPRPAPLTSALLSAEAAPVGPSAGVAERGHPTRDLLQYGSLGLAGLGLTLGVTGYVLREVNVRVYNDDARCARIEGVTRSDECSDEAAAWRRGEVMAIAGFAAAGVFGALALYLSLSEPEPRGGSASSCSLEGYGGSCRWRF